MSELTESPVETGEQDSEQGDESPSFDPATASFEDNSRITDAGRFMSALSRLREACESAVAEAIAYTNVTKAVAEARVLIRSTIMRPNGFPDWSADSDVYRQVVSIEEGKAFAKLTTDSKTRLVNAIKQQVKRNYLLPGVVAYILTTEANFGEELDKWNGEDGRDRVLSDPTEKLKTRVREHYSACGLDVPEGPFKEKKAAAPVTPGPDAGDNPESALDTLTEALGGLTQVLPVYSTAAILSTVSDLAKGLTGKTGAIDGRPKVIDNLHRIGFITETLASMLDGKLDGETFDTAMENMIAAYFTDADIPA